MIPIDIEKIIENLQNLSPEENLQMMKFVSSEVAKTLLRIDNFEKALQEYIAPKISADSLRINNLEKALRNLLAVFEKSLPEKILKQEAFQVAYKLISETKSNG